LHGVRCDLDPGAAAVSDLARPFAVDSLGRWGRGQQASEDARIAPARRFIVGIPQNSSLSGTLQPGRPDASLSLGSARRRAREATGLDAAHGMPPPLAGEAVRRSGRPANYGAFRWGMAGSEPAHQLALHDFGDDVDALG
jgi:hypothetical protein